MNWYSIKNMEAIDTPVLVIYRQRVVENILTAISMIGDVNRLRPHVKTHKSIEVAALQMNAGINKFKCATIAEAEMLGMAEAPDVLLAYQPAGPKLKRFIELIKKYPSTKFSCLVDNFQSIKMISDHAMENSVQIDVYIDLNVGMNRTGIQPGNIALELYRTCKKSGGIEPEGLHAYDGHIRSTDITERTIQCDKAFEAVLSMQEQLTKEGFPMPVIIAGGSPSFPVHAKKNGRECSPGTFVYWDKGYSDSFTEQHFLPAALVITRVISLPAKRKLCLDLGHKSTAAENSLDKRVWFLNAPALKFVSQSEEHLVVESTEDHHYKVGDILYGMPYHICPTVALYERTLVAENNEVTSEWRNIARDRKINV